MHGFSSAEGILTIGDEEEGGCVLSLFLSLWSGFTSHHQATHYYFVVLHPLTLSSSKDSLPRFQILDLLVQILTRSF